MYLINKKERICFYYFTEVHGFFKIQSYYLQVYLSVTALPILPIFLNNVLHDPTTV